MNKTLTKKAVKELNMPILSVGYCNLQSLLKYISPIGHSESVYGWDCDYFNICGTIISTGYRPIGTSIDHSIIKEYENKARIICDNIDLSHNDKDSLLYTLLLEFINKIKPLL